MKKPIFLWSMMEGPANDGETDGKKDANPMEKANEEITSLIKSYYTALGDKDITTLRTLVDNLAPADESTITNAKYIEGYEAGDIYTKKGLDDDSYVVYSCFYYICQGIDTKVPALAEFYVVKDTDGNWKIDGAVHDDSDEITKYEVSLRQDDDVKELKAKVQKQYEDAQTADPALAAFLDGLGEDVTGSAETADGTTLVVTEDCNVRAAASSDAEVIGGLSAGTEVVKKGESGADRIDRNNLMQYITPQDLKSFGLIPELVGRLPVLTYMQPLSREALRSILTEPKNAIVKQYKRLFELDNVKLTFDDAVLDYIVDKAVEFKLGARGLRSICEAIMMDTMFDLPSTDTRKFVVTLPYAKKKIEKANILELKQVG